MHLKSNQTTSQICTCLDPTFFSFKVICYCLSYKIAQCHYLSLSYLDGVVFSENKCFPNKTDSIATQLCCNYETSKICKTTIPNSGSLSFRGTKSRELQHFQCVLGDSNSFTLRNHLHNPFYLQVHSWNSGFSP